MATDFADMTRGATPATKLSIRPNSILYEQKLTILNVVRGSVEPVNENGVLGVVRLLLCDCQHAVGEARLHRCVVHHFLGLPVADGLLAQNGVLLHLLLGQPDELGAVSRLVAQSSGTQHRIGVLRAQVLKVLVRSLKTFPSKFCVLGANFFRCGTLFSG